MKYYKKITVFENTSRLRFLHKFRSLVENYFDKCHYDSYDGSRIENEDTQKCRREINLSLNKVARIIQLSGVSTSIYYSPPPITGGICGDIDLLQNIFMITNYHISPQQIIDLIDRSIGNYTHNRASSILRTINPFHWIDLCLSYIASLPFRFISKMGFSGGKVEASNVGKLIKGVLYLVTVLAALLTILHYLDLLPKFKDMIRL